MKERLRILRKHLKLSQGDFAKELGLSLSGIYQMEAGAHPVSEKTVDAVHRVFGVRREWLVRGEGEMFMPNRCNTYTMCVVGNRYEKSPIFHEILDYYAQLTNDEKDMLERFLYGFSQKVREGLENKKQIV